MQARSATPTRDRWNDRVVRHSAMRTFAWFVCLHVSVVFICGGATCARRRSAIPDFNPPPIFTTGTPSLPELIQQTNRSMAIETLASNSLTIESPDLAYKLTGNFSWQRPHSLRLETKLFSSALGTPLAAGSNSDMFWLVAQRPSPTIYYASHNEFEGQQGPRHVLPVSPLWLREAFGIVELDPTGRHEPPTPRADGKLQMVSYVGSPRGDYKRVLIMSPTTGTIEQTLLYDNGGKLIASARMSEHQYYSAIDWSLPHRVQVLLQPDVGDPLTFKIEVGFYSVNEPSKKSDSYAFPDTTGLSAVDLVQENAAFLQEPMVPSPNYQGNAPQMNPANSPAPHQSPTPTSGPRDITPPTYRTVSSNPLDDNWQKYLAR